MLMSAKPASNRRSRGGEGDAGRELGANVDAERGVAKGEDSGEKRLEL